MSRFDGAEYQARFDALAATGADMHGEATLVRSFAPASVIDAGCGTGRVAIELARHGIDVVGVDVNASMIAEARRLAPGLAWVEADLAGFDLGRTVDVVVLAGNVPIFCPAARRAALVASCAAHIAPGGAMLAGFGLGRGYDLADYDEACGAAGLVIDGRYSTWDRQPSGPGDDYAVSLHRRPAGP
jgi:SAM-dependent methyltransferase